MRRTRADDWGLEFPVILGQGSLHGLPDGDPRNPRLIGLKSVSYAAMCSIQRPTPNANRQPIGFHRPK